MATLVTIKGPEPGRQFPLPPGQTVIGRQSDSNICLESQAVSRHHARILCQDRGLFVEDLGSSNGTYLNGQRLSSRTSLAEGDTLQIGPYVFNLRPTPTLCPTDGDMVIRDQVNATCANFDLYTHDSAHKLQVVLEIAQHLARTLDLDPLLGKFLDQLIQLFPHADRGMVLLCEGDHLAMRAQRTRGRLDDDSFRYSRTIVRKALSDGIGILSEDVHADERFSPSQTLTSLNVRSIMCVPLISQDGKRLGVIQLDRVRPETSFRVEDLQMLTAVALQAAVVLENAELHAEVLREERLRQELAFAREIQQSFLPTNFRPLKDKSYELFARVHPARQVSGDLYDFFPIGTEKIAFFLGDVSGKGMPAALFMVAVRTLIRHLAAATDSPAETLNRLNDALADDNSSGMFVTLAHGIYTLATGEVVLASGGHMPPLIRRKDGQVAPVAMQPGRIIGAGGGNLRLSDVNIPLQPGETMVLYTDGFTESREPEQKTMFGVERLCEAVGGPRTHMSLETCAEEVKSIVMRFTRSQELQDDLTLFLLRRSAPTMTGTHPASSATSSPSPVP